MTKRYQVEQTPRPPRSSAWEVYDTQTDIYVDRHGNAFDDGYFTKAEATAVAKHLNKLFSL